MHDTSYNRHTISAVIRVSFFQLMTATATLTRGTRPLLDHPVTTRVPTTRVTTRPTPSLKQLPRKVI